MNLMRNIIAAALMTVVTTVLLGIIYPLLVTGSRRCCSPTRRTGS